MGPKGQEKTWPKAKPLLQDLEVRIYVEGPLLVLQKLAGMIIKGGSYTTLNKVFSTCISFLYTLPLDENPTEKVEQMRQVIVKLPITHCRVQ